MTKIQKLFMYYGMYRAAVFVHNVGHEVVRQQRLRYTDAAMSRRAQEHLAAES